MACIPVCGQHEAGLSIGFINSSNPDRIAEGKANAHLIVASPDLLESLESLFEIGDVFGSAIEHKDPHCQSFDEWSDKARAAIAKARGEA